MQNVYFYNLSSFMLLHELPRTQAQLRHCYLTHHLLLQLKITRESERHKSDLQLHISLTQTHKFSTQTLAWLP